MVQNVVVKFLKRTGKCGLALKQKSKKKSFDFRHILLPINLMINLIIFGFRAEIKKNISNLSIYNFQM